MFNGVKEVIEKYRLAIVFLFVVGIAYGLQIGKLGFYWDDWLFVYRYQTKGIFNTMYYADRSLGAIAHVPGFIFAGSSPLRWHIYMLLLRWLLVLSMWWTLDLLWPAKKNLTAFMGLLFAIYPVFTQHSIAVVYSIQYTAFLSLFLSFSFMLILIRKEKNLGIFLILSLLLQIPSLFMLEHFLGLEMARIFIIWLGINNKFLPLKKNNLFRAAKIYMPYFIVQVFYFLWRFGVFSRNEFRAYGHNLITDQIRANGILAVLDLLLMAGRDLIYLLVESWYQTINIDLINIEGPFNLLSLIVAMIMMITLWIFFQKNTKLVNGEEHGSEYFDYEFQISSIILGFALIIFSFSVFWVSGLEINGGLYNDRFGLPAMYGASILIVALVDWFMKGDQRRTILIICVFVGLGVGSQLRNTNQYRWEWTRQVRTYWQLFWRAPAIETGTTIVINGSISNTVNSYVTIFSFNYLYANDLMNGSVPLWVSNYNSVFENNMTNLLEEKYKIDQSFNEYFYEIEYPQILSVYQDYGRCLIVLSPGVEQLVSISDHFRSAALMSNVGLILQNEGFIPSELVFGSEPEHDWCYFFEKAELAAQMGEWQRVGELRDEVENLGLEGNTPEEYFVFIRGFAKVGDWDRAENLSMFVAERFKEDGELEVCKLWEEMGGDFGGDDGYVVVRGALYQFLDCENE